MNDKLTHDDLNLLAKYVVDCWDMDTLVSYAVENVLRDYLDWPEDVERDMADLELKIEDLRNNTASQ